MEPSIRIKERCDKTAVAIGLRVDQSSDVLRIPDIGEHAILQLRSIMQFIFMKDVFDMQTESVQTFNDRVAASPELQTKLRAVTSPLAFLDLAKAAGLELTGQDFQLIVQQAYQQWIALLDPKMSAFFNQVRSTPELDEQLKTCRSNVEVITLAQQCGVELSEDDLQQAAQAAAVVPGFSFEKLWFRGLGLLG